MNAAHIVKLCIHEYIQADANSNIQKHMRVCAGMLVMPLKSIYSAVRHSIRMQATVFQLD